jgi:hypothetical protein
LALVLASSTIAGEHVCLKTEGPTHFIRRRDDAIVSRCSHSRGASEFYRWPKEGMKLKMLFYWLALTLCVCSCTSARYAHKDWSDDAARREAQADIRTGSVKIYYGGDFVGGPLGVETAQEQWLIQGLPQKWFPTSGNYSLEGHRYGTAYNREVLKFLAQKPAARK